MARKKLQSATDQRPFVMIYHDFLESDLLKTSYEKMLFVALKKFSDSKNQCFPSLKTLSEISGMSKRKVQTTLKELEEKGIISIQQRNRADGGHSSNNYTLYDFPKMWGAGNKEEAEKAIDDYEVNKAIELLKAKGLISEADQSTEISPKNNSKLYNYTSDYNTEISQSQEYNVFTRQMLNEIFDFSIMVENNKANESLLDGIMELILELLNSNSSTIRVNKEDKPAEIVKSRLLKLNYMHIQYVADKVTEQSGIKDIRSYLITSLFNSYTTIDVHYSTMVNKNNK